MAPSKLAKEFLTFVNASPSPFQVVESAKSALRKSGFKELHERAPWADIVKSKGRYFVARNGTSLIAFIVGSSWRPGGAFSMIGTHTDSPCLRIKPVSKRTGDGYLQVGVETYGGGLWHTWFDRDLSLAGRMVIKKSTESGVALSTRIVKIDRPILRIPTLAIHLDRQEKFEFNKETQLFPIAGLVAAELNKSSEPAPEKTADNPSSFTPALKSMSERHHPALIKLLAEEAHVPASEIEDFELILYDTQQACFGGLSQEFIFSGRLDNQMMTFCALYGLLQSVPSPPSHSIRLISMFDHEEIGSLSRQGADSNFLTTVLERLSGLGDGEGADDDAAGRALAKSFLISADMAHAVHPNYPAKYEAEHRPAMNNGVVVKVNANARYATSSTGIALLKHWAELAAVPADGDEDAGPAGVPLQEFVVRNDSPCGGTIGTMLSAKLGVRTIDVGNPQLSMHSIRETCGSGDVDLAVRLFRSFFENFERVDMQFAD